MRRTAKKIGNKWKALTFALLLVVSLPAMFLTGGIGAGAAQAYDDQESDESLVEESDSDGFEETETWDVSDVSFDGSTSYGIDEDPPEEAFKIESTVTVDDLDDFNPIISWGSWDEGVSLYFDDSDHLLFRVDDGSSHDRIDAEHELSEGEEAEITAVYSDQSMYVEVDGEKIKESNSSAKSPEVDFEEDSHIGHYPDDRYFDGGIEEVTLSERDYERVDERVYIGSSNNQAEAFDPETGDVDPLFEIEHSESVGALTLSQDGETIAAGDYDDDLYIADTETSEVISDHSGHTDYIVAASFSRNGETVYTGSSDDTARAIDVETGDEVWSHDEGSQVRAIEPSPDGEMVALSGNGNDLRILDAESGGEIHSTDAGDTGYEVEWLDTETVLTGHANGEIQAHNWANDEVEWVKDGISDTAGAIEYIDGNLYVASYDEELARIDPDGGDEQWSVDIPGEASRQSGIATTEDGSLLVGYDDGVAAVEDHGSEGELVEEHEDIGDGWVRVATETSSAGQFDDPITGQVVDQSGDPVENATVAAQGADIPNIDDAVIEDLETEAENAEELLDKLGSLPEDFEEFEDDFGTGDRLLDPEEFADDVDATYPLVHEENDWGLGSTNMANENVDDPQLQIDSGETAVISLWDPAEEDWISNQVDNSFPGSTTSGEVEIRQIDPFGDTLETTTHETQPEYETTGGQITGSTDHHAVKTDLSTGIYQVHPEGYSERAYTFTIGEPEEIVSNFADDLEDEAGEFTERSNTLQELRDSDGLFVEQTEADEDGEFELSGIPHGAENTQIQAYSGPSELVDALEDIREDEFDEDDPPGIEDIELSDLRDYQSDFDYNGSFHMPAESRSADPGDEDVTVQTYGTTDLPFGDMDRYGSISDFLDEQRLDERTDELRSEYDERFEEMERDSLEDIYENHKTIVETVPDAEDRYLDRSAFDEVQEADNLSNEELSDETSEMQIAVANFADLEIPDMDDPLEIEDGELETEIPLPGGIDSDTLAPEIHWSNGSSETIDEEYFDIESGGFFDGDSISVSELPIDEDDPGAFEIRLQGANDDGVLDDRVGGENPNFSGEIPEIDAVNWNTMTPSSDDRLYVGLDADIESSYEQLTDVSAYGPDDDELDVDLDDDNDRASFNTDGEGVHTAQLTFESSTGDEYTITERVEAGEHSRSDPATIRASQSSLGTHAIIGEDLESARVDADSDDGVSVEALIDSDDDAPGELHVKPDSVLDGSEHTLDVAVLQGDDERQIQSHVSVFVHLDDYGEDTLASVNSASITQDGDTRWGEVDFRDDGEKGVLVTYTDENGAAEISIDQSPSQMDRFWHWADHAIWTPSILSSAVPVLLEFVMTIAVEVATMAETATTTAANIAPTAGPMTPVTAGPETAAATGVTSP